MYICIYIYPHIYNIYTYVHVYVLRRSGLRQKCCSGRRPRQHERRLLLQRSSSAVAFREKALLRERPPRLRERPPRLHRCSSAKKLGLVPGSNRSLSRH